MNRDTKTMFRSNPSNVMRGHGAASGARKRSGFPRILIFRPPPLSRVGHDSHDDLAVPSNREAL
jgi:hypothetical protein